MVRLFHCFGLVLLVAGGICFAQGELSGPKPNEVIIRFLDDTMVRRAILQDNVEIVTKYGKLAVPVGDIRRIEFGLHIPEATAKKVADTVKLLGNENFPQREAASKDLVALGFQAYPALLEVSKSSKDEEVLRRVQAAIVAIQEQVPEELLRLKPDDMIYTRESVFAGRISSPTLKVRTVYFGELELKLADLRSIHSMSGAGQATVTVDAAKHAGGKDQWMDSGFMVDADVGMVIVATGEVDLLPQQAGQVMSRPDGNPDIGVGGFGGVRYAPGTLLGRLGESGEVFAIGSRYEAKTRQEGKLYLSIVPMRNNNGGATGTYSVKIVAGPGVSVTPAARVPRGAATAKRGFGQ